MAFSTPNASTTTHSHVVPAKSDQPSLSSVRVDVRSASRARAGSFTSTRIRDAPSQVTASTASAQPGPTVTTSSAPTVGPTTRRAPRYIDCNTLACCSISRGTSCGVSAASAGWTTAIVRPWIASRTTSIHSSAVPVMTHAVTEPWVAARTRFPARRMSTRGRRSAMTPPKSRKTTIGIELAASTMPKALAELPTSSTAKVSATSAMVEPMRLTSPAR